MGCLIAARQTEEIESEGSCRVGVKLGLLLLPRTG